MSIIKFDGNALIDVGNSLKQLIIGQLNEQMIEVAEPILQKALLDIELKMREKLGATIIQYIDSAMDIERMGTNLRITIRRES